jgi:sodium/potassium-transporting ATPase subunit alpha
MAARRDHPPAPALPALARLLALAAEQAYPALDTRPSGLTRDEAHERRLRHGPNRLPEGRRLLWLRLLGKHLANLFFGLLVCAAAMSFVANALEPGQGMGVLGWALLAVALLNVTFSFAQEFRAERAMEALARLLPQRVSVRREGREQSLAADALVPGDVILVGEGDRVPADARVVRANDLVVSMAALTGESTPVRIVDVPQHGRPADARNVLLAGCTVLQGEGEALVGATGAHTLFGRTAALSHALTRPPTPLDREVRRMVRVLTGVAVTMGAAFFLYGLAAGRPPWTNLVFMLGIIVANVPEGLLPTFTLALAMGGRRLAARNVLVRSFASVETLGAVDTILTDKTGTLTRNELELARVVAPGGRAVEGTGELRAVLRLALVASEVHGGPRGLRGDPLDVLLARRYAALGGDVAAVMERVTRHFPFDVHKRREAGVLSDGDGRCLVVKGAWEVLREHVRAIRAPEGGEAAWSADAHAAADRTVERLAGEGHRVIALGTAPLAGDGDPDAQPLVLEGFLAVADALRAEVPSAVARCHRAAVRVVMVTGDYPATARAVARAAGIEGTDGDRVVTGAEIDAMGPEALGAALAGGTRVFARTTPEQKLRLVEAAHRLGWTVAMTGDGVNDAPALKAADVGVAMGMRGTEVAREAADVVLLDDHFASIVAGIEEGRAVFDNLKKFTNYVLVSNVPEIVPYLLFILFPVPLALNVIHILSIDLGTDIVPSIALGQEPPDADVMERPPRRRGEHLLSREIMLHSYAFLGVAEAVYALGLFFLVLRTGGWQWGGALDSGAPLLRSATGLTLASVVLMQIGNLVGRRAPHGSGIDRGLVTNRLLLVGVALEAAFSWAILYASPVRAVLGTAPVAPWMYALAWLGAPVLFGVDHLRKRWVRRRRERARPTRHDAGAAFGWARPG